MKIAQGCLLAFLIGSLLVGSNQSVADDKQRPNILFVLTDDQRWDGFGASGNDLIHTPNLDRIADGGVRFSNAFVTLAICSPSRAACLTGRYGSSNGVTAVGAVKLNAGEPTFARALRKVGYRTGVTGKWHLKTTPEECGFDFAATCWSNGTWYGRKFTINGTTRKMPGFVDDVTADESIRFIRGSQEGKKPFVLWMCTQVPHMDNKFEWPAEERYLDNYGVDEMPLPETWNDDLSGKPEYLKTARNRTQALKYGYDKPKAIRKHARDYYAGVQQMDAAVGRVLDELDRLKLRDNTWVIFMGDNGWMLGEHGMTSKVLPYEESMRVPMAIAGPNTTPRTSSQLVLNIDLTATIYELAGVPIPDTLHGRSLLELVRGKSPGDWRTSFLYEAPTPQLGSLPLWAVRTQRWKYVETQTGSGATFAELYDMQTDAIEMRNLAQKPEHKETTKKLAAQLREHRELLKSKVMPPAAKTRTDQKIPENPPEAPRTDIHISGVYPHLTTYGIYSQNGAHYKGGHRECGIGAVVPWAGRLWMVNYAPHMPKGSEHKLYSIDPDLKTMTIHPESVGGTPPGRMIHKESNQLLIAHYLIDDKGKVRTISPKDMPMRVTAIVRHLEDPANMVYYIDMEGSIWEANVHTLAVKRLFKKPVPGWHGKGAYSSQGRLVVSNNGEHAAGNYDDLVVGGPAKDEDEAGVLAEWDGSEWRIIERRQFTDVTGPRGIAGGGDGSDPIWAIGWDRRSLRLKLLEDGEWHTYLLPKAAWCNDARHGWYTEWPRIREITEGRWMMDMHGMFFDFPKTFSSNNSAGIKPIGSHLRYIPDFCAWNGALVLATDETSIQGNKLAGQPQSNLWFGRYEDLKSWGPANGYGGPWIEDEVTANTPSDPYLVAGFSRRVLHLATDHAKADPVVFTLQIDVEGDGHWVDHSTVEVPAQGYVCHLLPGNFKGVWLRLKTNRDCIATAVLHQTASQFPDGDTPTNATLFAGLAAADAADTHGALVYAAKRNRNLRVITDDERYFDFTKAGFEFEASQPDEKLAKLLEVEPEFTVDDASVILKHRGEKLRLPKGHPAFDKPFSSGWPRAIREVESERHLANIHGTFYEVPLIKSGQPPALHLMRPVASHSKRITDYCSWNGLLVLAGVNLDAKEDGHLFKSQDGTTGLWFGAIDDLWKLGKAVGVGGPWKDSAVMANAPSDAYLMTGYDNKTLELTADADVTITVEVDFDHQSGWHHFKSFALKADQTEIYVFPEAYSAHWVRVTAGKDCTATAWLTYE